MGKHEKGLVMARAGRRTRGRVREGVSLPVPPSHAEMPKDYGTLLADLKQRIAAERVRVALAANSAMVLLYWDIGQAIRQRQAAEGWGAKVIDRLSADLREAFPNMKGLSPRNLKYMRAFAEAWPDRTIVQEVLAQIPWYHHIALTLPPTDSDLAAQVFKDPYLFDFLGTADPRREREIEKALVDHVQKFLLELDAGFAFVGRQVQLEFAQDDYYLDRLFYHLKLRCFVVVELKAVPFEPEFVGKLNMYLSAVDDLLRHPDDKPTIGLLLCKGKDRIKAEYALRGFGKPIGVADWETRIVTELPRELESSLPSVEELEAELDTVAWGEKGEDEPRKTREAAAGKKEPRKAGQIRESKRAKT